MAAAAFAVAVSALAFEESEKSNVVVILPDDAASCFKIDGIDGSEFLWAALAGRACSVYWTESLQHPFFPIGGNPPGGNCTALHSVTNPNGFCRIDVSMDSCNRIPAGEFFPELYRLILLLVKSGQVFGKQVQVDLLSPCNNNFDCSW